jgi:DNA gyrase inhibitor GyrI
MGKALPQKKLKLERVGPTTVAFVHLTGPYEEWGKGLMQLGRWLESQGAHIVGNPIGLFYDNPTETPAANLQSDACFPIEGKVGASKRFKVMHLPGGEAAVTRHTGPPSEYTKTYGAFLEGLLKEGYMFYGPAREIFDEPSADLRPGMGMKIQQLVKKDR